MIIMGYRPLQQKKKKKKKSKKWY